MFVFLFSAAFFQLQLKQLNFEVERWMTLFRWKFDNEFFSICDLVLYWSLCINAERVGKKCGLFDEYQRRLLPQGQKCFLNASCYISCIQLWLKDHWYTKSGIWFREKYTSFLVKGKPIAGVLWWKRRVEDVFILNILRALCLSNIKRTEYKLRWFNNRLRGSSLIFFIVFVFFVRVIFRFYIKCRRRWMIWYDGRQLESHDSTFVIFSCPWFAVDLWISLIWSVLSLSKLVGAILSKLDWQCRYDFFENVGRL